MLPSPPNLDRNHGLPTGRHRQETSLPAWLTHPLLQVISVTLFEKMPISQALQQKDYTNPQPTDPDQMIMFNF
jgi:hypothetical protein